MPSLEDRKLFHEGDDAYQLAAYPLGMGVYSPFGAIRTLVIDPNSVPPDHWKGMNPELEAVADASVVLDRASYAKTMSMTASASYGPAEASASLSTDYRTSRRAVAVVLFRRVPLKKFVLVVPAWHPKVLEEFEDASARDAFKARYGDHYISEVTVGGLVSIVYRLGFADSSQASSFSASGEVKYGKGEASATYHQRIMKTAAKASIRMTAFSIGCSQTPELFSIVEESRRSTKDFDPTDGGLQTLLDFFNSFHTMINLPAAISMESQSIFMMRGAPTKGWYNADAVSRWIEEAKSLDEKIDKGLSAVDQMESEAIAWNVGTTREELQARAAVFENLRGDLLAEVDRLRRGVPDATPTAVVAPSLDVPSAWKLEPLAKQGTFIISSKGREPHTYSHSIPPHHDGTPLLIEAYFNKGRRNEAGLSFSWLPPSAEAPISEIVLDDFVATRKNPKKLLLACPRAASELQVTIRSGPNTGAGAVIEVFM
jgi:hypothetical protein